MILKEQKILFVHIPRTGGGSIKHFFRERKSNKNIQHKTLQDYNQEDDYSDYYKFTFVRNPWDRLVSWFLWAHGDLVYYQHMADQGMYCNRSLMSAWNKGCGVMQKHNVHINKKFYLKFKNAFAAFVETLPNLVLNDDPLFKDLNNTDYRLNGKWIMPQIDWIKNEDGKLGVDYVGKYENLQRNFKLILKKNDIEHKPLVLKNNINQRPCYKLFYTKKTQAIVGEVYKKDIKKFKYEF